MAGLIARFAALNGAASRGFDRIVPYPPQQTGSLGEYELRRMFGEGRTIADVGGGKKPYAVFAGLDVAGKTYVGLDLDPEELDRAPPGIYTETRVHDLCTDPGDLAGRFDLIVCRSTLEHVPDTAAAVAGIAAMLAPGGRCYLRLPCRRAIFARLNLLLPQGAKRRILHALFPHKQGDGFPVQYDRCTPSGIRTLALQSGLKVLAERRSFRSSYFGAFLPAYILWRGAATLQYVMDSDYCESFELVLCRPSALERQ